MRVKDINCTDTKLQFLYCLELSTEHARNCRAHLWQMSQEAASCFQDCLTTDCLGSLYLVKLEGSPHLVAPGLVSITSHVTVKHRLYKDAQNRLLWRDKICPACT